MINILLFADHKLKIMQNHFGATPKEYTTIKVQSEVSPVIHHPGKMLINSGCLMFSKWGSRDHLTISRKTMRNSTDPGRLPVIQWQGKSFYVDLRLHEIRRTDCPHERYDLDYIITDLSDEAYDKIERLQLDYYS